MITITGVRVQPSQEYAIPTNLPNRRLPSAPEDSDRVLATWFFPELGAYLCERYRTGGVTNFSDPELAPGHYTVLVPNGLCPTRIHPAWALSCFA